MPQKVQDPLRLCSKRKLIRLRGTSVPCRRIATDEKLSPRLATLSTSKQAGSVATSRTRSPFEEAFHGRATCDAKCPWRTGDWNSRQVRIRCTDIVVHQGTKSKPHLWARRRAAEHLACQI